MYRLSKTLMHGRRKDFFQGGASRGFPKIFFQGGPKVVKFVFYPSKMKKQPFFANNFKIQGMARFPAPLPTPMRLLKFVGSNLTPAEALFQCSLLPVLSYLTATCEAIILSVKE